MIDSQGVTFSFIPEDKIFGPSATIKIDGEEYNLIYIGLDPSDLSINEVVRIPDSGSTPALALNLIKSHKGIPELARQLGISLNYNAAGIVKLRTAFDKRLERLKIIQNIESSIRPLSFKRKLISDSDEALFVPQHHYAVLKSGTSRYSGLKTMGVGPCLVVTIYDDVAKVGMLAHVDGRVDFDLSMKLIEKEFNGLGGRLVRNDPANNDRIIFSIIGGDEESRIYIYKIRNVLNKYSHSEIKQAILTDKIEDAWLDINNGNIYSIDLNPYLRSYDIEKLFYIDDILYDPILKQVKTKA